MIATHNNAAIEDPIYYINVTPSNMLGTSRYLDGLRFISSNDCFSGRWDRVVFTAGPPESSDIQSESARLLDALKSAASFQHEERAHALFLMFDERAESLATGLGLNVCLPAAEMRSRLDDKITGTRLAEEAGVPAVPNVLAPIRSYADLRCRCSHLGNDLVVQLPFGDSGESTFFISSEADFDRHAAEIANEACVKIMRRIRCRQMTIEACNTRRGTFAGPLMKELVGFRELTPRKGGWCGNELASDADATLPLALRQQAQRAATGIGSVLAKHGYRGYFGIDFLLDEETGTLYFGELNPRITGATPLSTQAAFDEDLPPLVVLHLLEWLDRPISHDAETYNRRMLEARNTQTMGSLVIKHVSADPVIVDEAPESGVWRMSEDGKLRFVREAFDPSDLRSGELFLLRTADAGQVVPKGYCLARAFVRGSLLDADHRLNKRAAACIEAIRNTFSASRIVSCV